MTINKNDDYLSINESTVGFGRSVVYNTKHKPDNMGYSME